MPADVATIEPLPVRLDAARRAFADDAAAAVAAGHSVADVATAGGVTRQHLHRLLAAR